MTSAELAQVIDDPGTSDIPWRRPAGDGPSGSVDKAIDGIQFLLSAAGVPINLAPEQIPGEPTPTQDGEVYVGFISIDCAGAFDGCCSVPQHETRSPSTPP